MSQRAAAAGGAEKSAFLASALSGGSSARNKYSTDQSSRKAASGAGSSGYTPVPLLPVAGEAPVGGNSTANSSVEDLARQMEPSFVGVLLNPRRSLRVINRD